MKKIRYNIADNKKIDYLKFSFYLSLAMLVSLAFIAVGIGNLWSSERNIKEQKEQAQQDRLEIEKLDQENNRREQNVTQSRKEWKTRVDFANWLIKEKQISVIDKLEILEKKLPEGVFFLQVVLDVENSSIMRIIIAADSLSRLIEAYHNFSEYQPTIQDEKEEDGLLKAGLVLHFVSKNQKSAEAGKAKAEPKKSKKIIDMEELE
ncbi:MAG: hypothetical protein MUF15_01830 [Acidobacteria bacterium]|jgi:hypothetical protein|nr:hypothetical protein [Acidobacteriota bacterium]